MPHTRHATYGDECPTCGVSSGYASRLKALEDLVATQKKVSEENSKKLTEVLDMLRMSKLGVAMVKWCVGIGAGIMAIIAAVHALGGK